MELRCENKKHAEVHGRIVEIRCNSSFCGKRPGVIVLHRFNLETGEVETKRYLDPAAERSDRK
jgi:hypothetical protein